MQTSFACAAFGGQSGLTLGSECATLPLEMYHLSVKAHSRSNGASATAAAAYRSGESITDERTGQVHDYTRRAGVVSTGIIGWHGDRANLWNAAEASEKRSNSTVAREYEIALPADTTDEARKNMVERFGQWLADRYGVAVDYAIHRPHRTGDARNHHAHVLTTTRRIDGGQLAEKTRILDDRKTGSAEVEVIRAQWGGICGMDHRSFKSRGIERIPKKHEGKASTHARRRTGWISGIALENQDIKDTNRELERLEAMQQDLERAAQIEEETIRRLRKEWEEEKAREAREAAARRKAMLAQAIDYCNILGAERRERDPKLKEILRQHEAAKRMKDWDSAALILIEFWRSKLAEYPDLTTAPEIARAEIARADAAAQKPKTDYAEDAIRAIQDPTEYPAGYRTASEIKAAKEAARRRGGGIGGR